MFIRPLTEPEQHRLRGTGEPGRTIVAVDDDEIAGAVAIVSRELTVPGAVVPVAWVVRAEVSPTHRGRGLLAEMMTRQLTELYESGETVSAAASGRCARFGYGPASRALRLRTSGVSTPDSATSRIRLLEASSPELERVYDAVRRTSVGWISRPPRFWAALPASWGAAVLDSPEDGYALYRPGDAGELQVAEVGAATAQGAATLWRFLLNTGCGTSAQVPVDSPLLGTSRPTPVDTLWVRLVDVERALAVRRYTVPLDVVLSVCDSFCPWNTGRYHLATDGTRVTCSRTSAPAELCVSAADLGAAYLGGPTLTALAGSSRVIELRPGALSRTSAAFRGEHEPFHPSGMDS